MNKFKKKNISKEEQKYICEETEKNANLLLVDCDE